MALNRIKGKESDLSSQEYIYSCSNFYTDFCQSLVDIWQISYLPYLVSYDKAGIDLGMFNFPFQNKGAYASPLLSVEPNAQDTFDLTKGMYRAIKYHFCNQSQEYDATGTTTYPNLSGFMTQNAIPVGNSPWD